MVLNPKHLKKRAFRHRKNYKRWARKHNINKMTLAEKYNFKTEVDQHGRSVNGFFEDKAERKLIDIFEKELLNLKDKKNPPYSMIELGSNHAWYSLLFKSIFGEKETVSILIEPLIHHMERGKRHFELNNYKGIFYDTIIGKAKKTNDGTVHSVPVADLKKIINENNLDKIDILHSDIDGFEVDLLLDYEDLFKNGTFDLIFLLTHSGGISVIQDENGCDEEIKDTRSFCKEKFNNLPYDLILEVSDWSIGKDSLLVYKRK